METEDRAKSDAVGTWPPVLRTSGTGHQGGEVGDLFKASSQQVNRAVVEIEFR